MSSYQVGRILQTGTPITIPLWIINAIGTSDYMHDFPCVHSLSFQYWIGIKTLILNQLNGNNHPIPRLIDPRKGRILTWPSGHSEVVLCRVTPTIALRVILIVLSMRDGQVGWKHQNGKHLPHLRKPLSINCFQHFGIIGIREHHHGVPLVFIPGLRVNI